MTPRTPQTVPMAAPSRERGFILIFTILMLLGISALAVGMVYNAYYGRVASQNYKNRLKAFYASDGMRTLLAQEVIDGNIKLYLDTSRSGEITGEVWDGIGLGMASMKTAMGGAPSRTVTSTYLGSNWKTQINYGIRWRGYVIPPATGPYTFFMRADDEGELYLSSDDQPANLSITPIAAVSSWLYSWPKDGTGVSTPISLKIGKRYYFEFLHAQGSGNGFGQIGWRGPNYLTERPIPSKRLASYGSNSGKWDTAMVGKGRVKYALSEAGPLVYTLNTEAILGGMGDTTFRSPLTQTLSLRAGNPAPPDTIWQRVIYYDFRADRSNPEFSRGWDFGPGMVAQNMVRLKGLAKETKNADYFGLDSIGKPVLGTNPKFNCGVDKWFREWTPGWFFTYKYAGWESDCTVSPSPGNDTSFKNIVFKDSLPFVRQPDLGVNAYQFKRFGAAHIAAFSPLDNRGFGDEGNMDGTATLRNYCFCMEIHSQFEHTSGMTFEFNGDDDAWLFINDSLVMDLGFVHISSNAEVVLDDLPLTFGETYSLDFFYCERQPIGSSIDLITNLPVLLKSGKPASSWKRDYGNLD